MTFHALRGCAIWLLVACDGPSSPGGGAIAVSGSIAGGGADPNGFELAIDRGSMVPFDGVGPLVLAPIASGVHSVELQGIAGNCRLTSPAVQQVVVEESDTAQVAIALVCQRLGGVLEVSVATTGTEVDPNGFGINVDGAVLGDVGPQGSFSVPLSEGVHTVGLDEITANCNAEGGNSRTVLIPPGGLIPLRFQVECVAAPPAGHGRELALIRSGEPGSSTLLLMNEDGTGIRTLPVAPTTLPQQPAWDPAGDRIVLEVSPSTQSPGELALIDVASGAVSAIPATEGALSPAWSPSGQGIVFTQPVPATGSVELFRAAPDGTNREQLTSSEASVAADPSWSPDGAQIAYVYMNDVDFALELRVLKLQDKSTRVLVEGDSEQGISDPTWSPDGRSIAFAMADFTIPFHIFVTPVDTPAPRELTSPDATSQAPSWSPDGTRIAYSGNQAGNFELYLMNADGTRHVRVTNNEDFDEQPAWRP